MKERILSSITIGLLNIFFYKQYNSLLLLEKRSKDNLLRLEQTLDFKNTKKVEQFHLS